MSRKRNRRFDEVMIVNPHHPGRGPSEGVRFMSLNNGHPGAGWFAEAPEDYGYFAEEPEFGDYGEDEPFGDDEPLSEYEPYGEYEPFAGCAGCSGQCGFAGYGWYGEADPYVGYGWYGDADPYGGYGGYGYGAYDPAAGYGYAPLGYYAEPEPIGWYGQAPEMLGYGPLGEYDPAAGYGNPYGFAGYQRDVPSPFNAGCPIPTNLSGYGSAELEGYTQPADVSPRVDNFTPPGASRSALPETLRPLW